MIKLVLNKYLYTYVLIDNKQQYKNIYYRV